MTDLLNISNLTSSFMIEGREVHAVEDLNLSMSAGQTLGLVGESGCGKSVTALSIMRLFHASSGKITSGSIHFKQQNLLSLSEAEMRKLRGNRLSMIFQEPMTSLNPVFTIGNQISEVFSVHHSLSRHEAMDKTIAILKAVNIPSAEKRVNEYPHQLSGGMRQRVMIAMALACNPELLIADEPTTALDVTIQAQILSLMNRLQKQLGMAILLITHDLGVVSQVCDDVAVMYAGKVVESGKTKDLFLYPKHPYTQALLLSIPKLGAKQKTLASIPGHVPSLENRGIGCRFANRCPKVMERCHQQQPILSGDAQHKVACWLYD